MEDDPLHQAGSQLINCTIDHNKCHCLLHTELKLPFLHRQKWQGWDQIKAVHQTSITLVCAGVLNSSNVFQHDPSAFTPLPAVVNDFICRHLGQVFSQSDLCHWTNKWHCLLRLNCTLSKWTCLTAYACWFLFHFKHTGPFPACRSGHGTIQCLHKNTVVGMFPYALVQVEAVEFNKGFCMCVMMWASAEKADMLLGSGRAACICVHTHRTLSFGLDIQQDFRPQWLRLHAGA